MGWAVVLVVSRNVNFCVRFEVLEDMVQEGKER